MLPETLAQEQVPNELDNLLDRTACPEFDNPYNPEAFSLSLEIEIACQEAVEREKNRLAAKAAAEQLESPAAAVTPEEVPDSYYRDLVEREKKFALASLEALLDLEASIIEEVSEMTIDELAELDDINFVDDLQKSQQLLDDKFIAIVPDWDRVRGNNDDAGATVLRPGWVPMLRAAKSRLRIRLEVGDGVSTRPLRNLASDRTHEAYRDMHNPELTISTSDSPFIQSLDDDLLIERNRGEAFEHAAYAKLTVEEKKALQMEQREKTWERYQAAVGHLLKCYLLEETLLDSSLINEKVLAWNELMERYPNGHFLFMDDDPFATTLQTSHPRFRAIHVHREIESRLANDWRYVFERELDPESR